ALRRYEPRNHRHRRGLSRAVGAEQSDELPPLDRKRHIVDRDERAERLAKILDGQHDGTLARSARAQPALRRKARFIGRRALGNRYSARAMIGSMRVARRAGSAHAAVATIASSAVTTTSTAGSNGLTPKS